MKYAVSPIGIEQLNKLAHDLHGAVSQMETAVKNMNSAVAGNVQGAGPHFEDIQQIISAVAFSANRIREPIDEIVETLDDLAEEYQAIIDKKIALAGGTAGAVGAGISAGAASGTSSGTAGSAGSISSGKEVLSEGVAGSAADVSFGVGGENSAIQRGLMNNLPEGYSYNEGNPQLPTYIDSPSGQIKAVMGSVFKGSGTIVLPVHASTLLKGIRAFTGNDYKIMRKAYQDGISSGQLKENLDAVDEYVHSAPKYEGTVMRGIHVSEEVARKWLTGEPFGMLGPSSWSTDPNVAADFAIGRYDPNPGPVKAVFVLEKNISGAAVTNISSYMGIESEVLAPSDTRYVCDRWKTTGGGGLIVYVHEVFS